MTRRDVVKALASNGRAAGWPPCRRMGQGIRHVDIIHHTHTDFGYHRHAVGVPRSPGAIPGRRSSDLPRRYAIPLDRRRHGRPGRLVAGRDRPGAGASFCAWCAIRADGRDGDGLQPGALHERACSGAARSTGCPSHLLDAVHPRAAMQNDVNGCPRAGAMLLLDRGIRHLLMGINPDSGGPPFRRPSAFWWKMPDGRRMFVWLGDHYGTAYSYFEPNWTGSAVRLRRPMPRSAHRVRATTLRTDEASLRACQVNLTGRLKKLAADGYAHDRLIVSYTNQWRYDNDVPFPPLAAVRRGLERSRSHARPAIYYGHAGCIRHGARRGGSIPTLEGEWTDWWANGDASGPREVAASRIAKRNIAAALAPVWGAPSAVKQKTGEMLKDLCLFDEHTWGANISVRSRTRCSPSRSTPRRA
jgi:hypothetical protein